MIVSSQILLKKAQEDHYAVGAFNTSDLEITKGIVAAAEEMNSPIILQTSEGEIKHAGMEIFFDSMKIFAEKSKAQINLNLDHGKSFEMCKWAVDNGYNSVMIDGSKMSLDENIELTKQVVDYAHERSVVVEGEIGLVPTPSKDENVRILKADPIECQKFIEKTGVDFLAVGIGNVHGENKGNPVLDFDRLKKIFQVVNIPLVLHGGSGISSEDIKKAISMGICKINVNTELRLAFAKALREILEDEDVIKPYDIMEPIDDVIKEVVRKKIEIFGSKNKI
ncbi:MAG: class II fructose-bisphosphate aldolase family protein [Patescibacteria group bacterium]|nr:class II fructose-bisphosphate aldolase family protein [Patescibacteria group bacterium]